MVADAFSFLPPGVPAGTAGGAAGVGRAEGGWGGWGGGSELAACLAWPACLPACMHACTLCGAAVVAPDLTAAARTPTPAVRTIDNETGVVV